MSIQQALLVELTREQDNTLRMIKAVPNGQFDFKPHEKSMTLGQLANHIVELHNWVRLALTKDVFDFHTDYQPLVKVNSEGLADELALGFEANKTIIESLKEETYFSNWTLKAGDHIIAEMPKAAAFRFIVMNHLIHHRGQLSVYLRLLDVPIPGVYGPSADDKM